MTDLPNMALFVVGGPDLFERTYKSNGKTLNYYGVPECFVEPIHSGRMAEDLFRTYGLARGRQILGTYDVVRRKAAAQVVHARWWLVDQFGRPLSLDHIAAECLVAWRQALTAENIAEMVADIQALLDRGWLAWADYRPVEKQLTWPRYPGSASEQERGSGTTPESCQSDSGIAPEPFLPTSNKQAAKQQQNNQQRTSSNSAPRASADTEPVGSLGAEEARDGGGAALPALLPEDGPDQTVMGLLRLLGGFDALAAAEIAAEPNVDAEAVRDAVEYADLMEVGRKLRGTRQAAIRGFLRDGGYRLPPELERKRRRPWRHLVEADDVRAPPRKGRRT